MAAAAWPWSGVAVPAVLAGEAAAVSDECREVPPNRTLLNHYSVMKQHARTAAENARVQQLLASTRAFTLEQRALRNQRSGPQTRGI